MNAQNASSPARRGTARLGNCRTLHSIDEAPHQPPTRKPEAGFTRLELAFVVGR